MNNMRTDIALIKQKSEFIEEKLQEIIQKMTTVENNLSEKELVGKSDLDNHVVHDRWMFSLVITLLVCIFGKLIYG